MKADPLNLERRVRLAEEAAHQQQFERMVEKADVLTVMGTPGGRKFLRRLLAQMGVRLPTSAVDDRVTAGRAALHDFAMQFEQWIERVAPEEAAEMHRERIAEDLDRTMTNDRRN